MERANNCCESCEVANGDYGYRDKDGNFYSWQAIEDALEKNGYDVFDHELKNCLDKDGRAKRAIKIVLTIAHLDHDITNNDYANLKALCQRCHLHLDLHQHQRNARETRNKNKGLQELF